MNFEEALAGEPILVEYGKLGRRKTAKGHIVRVPDSTSTFVIIAANESVVISKSQLDYICHYDKTNKSIRNSTAAYPHFSIVGMYQEQLDFVQPKWQPIETAPLEKAVLVFYKNSLGKDRIIKAQYIKSYTEEASEESIDCGFFDYCVETDEYYTPEGWYELVDNSGEYFYYSFEATNNPTHWMSLPQPPEEQQ